MSLRSYLKSLISVTVIVLSFHLPVQAQEEGNDEVFETIETIEHIGHPKPSLRSWKLLLSSGYLTEYQKSVDASGYEPTSQVIYSAGLQNEYFQYTLSYFQADNSSSTGNFSIFTERRSWNMEMQYMTKPSGFWSPLVGASIGTYKDKITTRFGPDIVIQNGDQMLMGALTGGVQFRFLRLLYSDLTMKFQKRESSKDIEWASQASLGFRL